MSNPGMVKGFVNKKSQMITRAYDVKCHYIYYIDVQYNEHTRSEERLLN
jgi:hypothetical protein